MRKSFTTLDIANDDATVIEIKQKIMKKDLK